MTDIRQQITIQLEAYHTLEALKAAVQDWVSASDGSLDAFEKALAAHRDDDADFPGVGDAENWEWGEIDQSLQFTSLIEQEMIQKSLEALEGYRRTGQGIPHDQMKAWVATLGTDRKFPCP